MFEKIMNFSKQENSSSVGIYCRNDVKVWVFDHELFIHCVNGTIVDHNLDIRQDGNWFLYCLTSKGTLYRVEKRQGEMIARPKSPNDYDQTEIFSELLGQQDNDNDILKLHISTQPVYILQDSDIIGQHHEVPVAVCISLDHIVIVKDSKEEFTFSMYSKTNELSNEAIVKLPKNVGRNDKFSKTILVKVVTCDCIDNVESITSGVIKLDSTLFKQLFGEDVLLLNSPILLVSQADGSVNFIPFSSFSSRQKIMDESILFEREEYKSSWNLLCQMSDTVLEITSLDLIKYDMLNYDSTGTALCFCGYDGQVLLFWNESGNSEYLVSEIFIHSPVLSVQSFHNKLYHSDGDHMFESLVEVHTRDINLPRNKQLYISKTKVLNDKHVSKIHAISADGYVKSQASPCSIYCSFGNGQRCVIETSSWSDTDTGMSRVETLKEILTCIDEVDSRRQKLKQKVKMQEENIKQLGIASFLMAAYNQQKNGLCRDEPNTSSTDRLSTECPFSVIHKLSAQMKSDHDDVEITVEVINQMAVPLSSDWTITASVLTLGNDEVDGNSVKAHKERKENEPLMVVLSVPFHKILSTCKLIVKAVLLTENKTTTEYCRTSTKEGALAKEISVPIYEKDIDIIDCLMTAGRKNGVYKNLSKSKIKTYRAIETHGESRMSKMKLLGTCSTEDVGGVTVCTRNVLCFPLSAFGDAPENATRYLQDLLFGKMVANLDDLKPNDCQMYTALGHPVHISILPVKQDVNIKDVVTVEVIVRSSSRIAAAVHRAIISREQQILSSLRTTMSTQTARRALHIAQGTINEMCGTVQNEAEIAETYQKMRNIPF